MLASLCSLATRVPDVPALASHRFTGSLQPSKSSAV